MSRNTIFLPKGYELTLTTDASSSGFYEQLPNPGGSKNTPVAISASSTVYVGSFSDDRYYALDSTTGAISHSMSRSVSVDYSNNSTARRLRGLDYSGNQVQGYEGIFYNSSYDTWGTLKTRMSFGSNTSMDMIFQASNDLLFLCTNDGSGSEGKAKFMVDADQSVEFHFSNDLTPNKIVEIDTNGIEINGDAVATRPYAESVENGALATEGVVLLTKATAGAYTLALPAAADDGKQLVISSGTAAAHVVTLPSESLYDGTGTPKDTITFDAQIGASVHLVSINQTYHLVGDCSTVTLTDEA